jgi:hypothetical protein
MKIALAQMNPVVGDLEGNAERIADLALQAAEAGAALLVTPELALCGYPPEDLALRDDFYDENARILAALADRLAPGADRGGGPPPQGRRGTLQRRVGAAGRRDHRGLSQADPAQPFGVR